MKLYLSSYKLGDKSAKIKQLISNDKPLAYISNALDFSTDLERRRNSEEGDINDLKSVGVRVDKVDLRDYFNKKSELEYKMNDYSGVWVRGGNVFVLRQSFKISGFDEIITRRKSNPEFFYGGYSAGICILGNTLRGIDLADDPNIHPYKELKETIWDGLGLLSYSIAPHYDSVHKESENMNSVVSYFIKNKILFRALSDGEVIITEA